MVSMERPEDNAWTRYDHVDRLIEDLKRNKTPHAVELVSKRFDGGRGAPLGDALAGNASLKWLRLDECRFGMEGAAGIGMALGSNTTLLGLIVIAGLEGTDVGRIAEGIGKSRSLKEIKISQCPEIYPVGGMAVGKALGESQTLERLFLSFNAIGDEGAVGIAEGIGKSRSLKEIHLRECDIGGEGCVAVGKALGESQTLEKIHMRGNHIGDAGAVGMAEGIGKSRSLKEINLSYCEIRAEGCVAVAKALGESQTLEILDMFGNHIGDAGAVWMAEGIGKSRSLKEINLNACKIGAEGFVAVGKALGESQTLETLFMFGNDIGDEGMVAISEGVAISTALTSLHLRGIKCSERAWVTLLLAIKQSHNCKTFHLQVLYEDWGRSDGPKDLVGVLWEELDLPPGAEGWRYKDIFEYWAREEKDRQKMVAFAMCMHPRLAGRQGSGEEGGPVCHCHGMKEDAFRLVGVAFLGR